MFRRLRKGIKIRLISMIGISIGTATNIGSKVGTVNGYGNGRPESWPHRPPINRLRIWRSGASSLTFVAEEYIYSHSYDANQYSFGIKKDNFQELWDHFYHFIKHNLMQM